MESGGDAANIKMMGSYAIGLATLAIISLMGIAVLTGFKTTGQVNNTTADQFITGIGTFGVFAGIIAITLVGKIVINLFR